jgi:hypothetical protein
LDAVLDAGLLTALPTGLATGLAGAFVSALRAEAAGADFAPPDDFDFATVLSTVFATAFLDFATALAMADYNPKREEKMRALHHFGGVRASRETAFPWLEAKHPEHAEPGETNDDQVNRDDEIQEPRHDQDQDSRDQGDDRGNVRGGEGH